MKHNTKWWLISIIGLLVWACKHQAPDKAELREDDIVTGPGDVFISGTVLQNGKRQACIWKNDTIQILDTSESAALDIFVIDGSTLVGGQHDNKPCYWLNGNKTMIDLPGEGAVTAVQIKKGTTYLVGYVHEGPIRTRGFLAIGNDVHYLNEHSGCANDFVFDANDLYIAGMDEGRPCYWKNENMITLAERENAVAIDAANGKVVVAGETRHNEGLVYGVWQDGQFGLMSNQSIQKLRIGDGKLYVLGNKSVSSNKDGGVSRGFVSKEGVYTAILGENAQSSTFVNDIFFKNSKMFVLGITLNPGETGNGRLTCWLDDHMHVLPSGNQSIGSAIFIK